MTTFFLNFLPASIVVVVIVVISEKSSNNSRYNKTRGSSCSWVKNVEQEKQRKKKKIFSFSLQY